MVDSNLMVVCSEEILNEDIFDMNYKYVLKRFYCKFFIEINNEEDLINNYEYF